MVEFLVAVPLALIAIVLLVSTMTAAAKQRTVHRVNAAVSYEARSVLERMIAIDTSTVWSLYNENPFDDPGGPGTAPGRHFSIPGLKTLASDGDGFVGEVILPAFNVGTPLAPVWALREDAIDGELGLPRDLNGDHVIDSADHANDYRILPVRVRVEWQGELGPRRFELASTLVDYVR